MDSVKVGDTVRILRKAAGLTTTDLAKKTGASTTLLSLIEKGERTPSVPLLKKMAEALRIPMSSFLLLLSDSNDMSSSDPYVNQIAETVQALSKMEKQLRELLNR